MGGADGRDDLLDPGLLERVRIDDSVRGDVVDDGAVEADDATEVGDLLGDRGQPPDRAPGDEDERDPHPLAAVDRIDRHLRDRLPVEEQGAVDVAGDEPEVEVRRR